MYPGHNAEFKFWNSIATATVLVTVILRINFSTGLTDLETMDYSSTTTRSHAVSGLNSSTTPLAIYSSNVTTLELLNTTTTNDGE